MSSPSTRNEAEALFFDWQGGSQFGFRSGGGFGFLTHGACLPDQARDSRDYSARSFCVAGNSLYGYTALCELVRPIRRHALRSIGMLDEMTSEAIRQKVLRILG